MKNRVEYLDMKKSIKESFVLLLPDYSNGMSKEPRKKGRSTETNENPDSPDNPGLYSEPDRGGTYYAFGCLLSIIAACMRALSMAGSQMLDNLAGEFQLNVGRFSSMLLFLVPYLVIKQPSLRVSKPNTVILVALALVTFGVNIFIYASTVYIPVGTAVTVINTSFMGIILMTSLVNWYCVSSVGLDVKSSMLDAIAVIISCFGVIAIIQPRFFFQNMEIFKTEFANYTSYCNPGRFVLNETIPLSSDTKRHMLEEVSWKGYLHASLAGLFNALRIILNKKLLKSEDVYPVLFWTAAIATFLSVFCTICFERFVFPEITSCVLILIGHASATGIQTVLLVLSLKYVPSNDVTLIYSFSVALLFAFQFTFLKTSSPAPHNALAIAGAVMVALISIGKPIAECAHADYSKKNGKKSISCQIPSR